MWIGHFDADSYYVAALLLRHPELRGLPVAVGGDQSLRHGIILSRSYEAKPYGFSVGNALWQARQACRQLTILPPDFPHFERLSGQMREIFRDYTLLLEGYGLDELFAGFRGCPDPLKIALEIQAKVLRELGLTLSFGLSHSKVFAKLGSDLNKPNGHTVITPDNYKDIVWPLPVKDLLYVGPQTEKKLHAMDIHTIGQLANMDPMKAKARFGKNGLMLRDFANGKDHSNVARWDELAPGVSIGHSSTTYRDLNNEQDVRIMFNLLGDAVAKKIRESGQVAKTIEISLRNSDMSGITRQRTMARPTQITSEMVDMAMELYREHHASRMPIRTIGIRATNFRPASASEQLSMWYEDEEKREKKLALDLVKDRINDRYGEGTLRVGTLLLDKKLTSEKVSASHNNYFGVYQGGKVG